jgi:hypothetical protein
MTGHRSRLLTVGSAGSFVAHVCLFAVFASIEWSISRWLPIATTTDNVKHVHGWGFDADGASGTSQGHARSGGTAAAPPDRVAGPYEDLTDAHFSG